MSCQKLWHLNRKSHDWHVELSLSGGDTTSESYIEARRRWGEEYDASPEIQSKVKEDWEARGAQPEEDIANRAGESRFEPSLLGLDTAEHALKPELLGKWLDENGFSSFTAAADRVLDNGLGDMLISDPLDSAPVDLDFPSPCWEATPGVCRNQDADILDIVNHNCRSLGQVVAHLCSTKKDGKNTRGSVLQICG